jgi:SAM-dependent methyltransferase
MTMNLVRMAVRVSVFVAVMTVPCALHAQETKQYEPQIGQAGKDVVWVPTPQSLVEKMIDMAKVTPEDLVMDLGSGDGRNIIAAAKRGARAIGVEFNPDMVELSKRMAANEGVSDKATFIEGDMYEADISKATVMALFLLTDNMEQLLPKFLALKPGSRIVANTFGFRSWDPDETQTVEEGCTSWCKALLWIVPAKVEGTWRLPEGELVLEQKYQVLSGTLTIDGRPTPIGNGRVRGDQITFAIGDKQYSGSINGQKISGTFKSAAADGSWEATRQ